MSAGRAVVVGATSWGCTLAIQLVRAGTDVTVLCRTPAEAQQLSVEREQRRLLPGIELPAAIRFLHDPADAAQSDMILFAVPAQRMRENATTLLGALRSTPLPPLVSAAKGLEVGTDLRMSQVLQACLAEAGWGADAQPPVAVISGPNLAREIAQGLPAATVVAGPDEVTERIRALLATPAFRVYANRDTVGVELGGALKNVIALGVGIADGLQIGENARAAFITRGLTEMVRLGVALGAEPLTITGLAGLGDLIATSVSPKSRNHQVGEALGRGRSLADVLAGMVHVAEGVETTRAARSLARRAGVEMPIVEVMHRVLFEGEPPTSAVHALLARAAQDELTGMSDPI